MLRELLLTLMECWIYMRQYIMPLLVQIITCCTTGDKPSSEPNMSYFLLEYWDKIIMQVESNACLHTRKLFWQFRLQHTGNFFLCCGVSWHFECVNYKKKNQKNQTNMGINIFTLNNITLRLMPEDSADMVGVCRIWFRWWLGAVRHKLGQYVVSQVYNGFTIYKLRLGNNHPCICFFYYRRRIEQVFLK